MDRVHWDGSPRKVDSPQLPVNLSETIFDYLPAPVPMTPMLAEMARKYQSGEWTQTPQHYAAMQAAYFVQPKSPEFHQRRRDTFHARTAEAAAIGLVVPENFRKLVETDASIDRLHHNTIWLEMPQQLWRLPNDPSRLVFLAFIEGHAGCGWHLLLGEDGSHGVGFCEHPFGLPSSWPNRQVPDYSQWKMMRCADTIEEWLYYYFLDCAEHDRQYIDRLRPFYDAATGD